MNSIQTEAATASLSESFEINSDLSVLGRLCSHFVSSRILLLDEGLLAFRYRWPRRGREQAEGCVLPGHDCAVSRVRGGHNRPSVLREEPTVSRLRDAVRIQDHVDNVPAWLVPILGSSRRHGQVSGPSCRADGG